MIPTSTALPPLYVDLDGTLVSTDTLWESLICLARQNPRAFLGVLPSLLRGKAAFKTALGEATDFAVPSLPYREEVLAFLREERARGRKIILATAAHERIAQPIADHLGLFDDVIATNAHQNAIGTTKRNLIQAHANGPYEYIGDHPIDLPIWQASSTAHGVFPVGARWHASIPREQQGRVFTHTSGRLADLFQAMRPKQWSKNILLFLPLLLSHTFTHVEKLAQVSIAFISFSLTASCVYLLNDLFDVHADRLHPKKRLRPFAKGSYALADGLVAAIILLGAGLVFAFIVSPLFALVISGYFIGNLLYTFWLKRVALLDVLLLGFFYTYRILAGAVATHIYVTDWLLAFSTFFFLSLAILKRYGELRLMAATSGTSAHGRGYESEDVTLLLGFGLNSAFLSVLVLSLYIHSSEVTKLYQHSSLLWGVVMLFLYWIMRIWLLVHRGVVQDDPLLFTLRDRTSALLASGAVILLLLATFLP